MGFFNPHFFSKIYHFIFRADTGNTGKQAAIIGGASAAGGIGLLLIIGGVGFAVVKFRPVRLLIKKPNQVRDLQATQDGSANRIEEDDMIARNEIFYLNVDA